MLTTLRFICRTITVVLVLLMLTMIVVVNSLVVTRYFFSYSPSWTEEVTRYAMIWLVMLGAGVLTLFDDHIALTMVVDKLSPRMRAWQRLFVQIFVFGVALLIAWKGFEFALGLRGVVAPALQISMHYAGLAVPVGAVVIVVFAALRVVEEALVIIGGPPLPIPDQFDYMDNSFKTAEENETHISHPGDHGDHRGAY